MSSKRQGDFLKELQAQKEPTKQERFSWKSDVGVRQPAEALGLRDKQKLSTSKQKTRKSFLNETKAHKTEVRKKRS